MPFFLKLAPFYYAVNSLCQIVEALVVAKAALISSW
jgi:hypothetical protein